MIRYIQLKKIAYHPNLYKSIIYMSVNHPTQYDESDDLEYIKNIKKTIVKKSCKKVRWGEATIDME